MIPACVDNWVERHGIATTLAALGLLAALAIGCSAVRNEGSRVRVMRCDVIVDDELGRMPPSHGGPTPQGENGTGIECDFWRFG